MSLGAPLGLLALLALPALAAAYFLRRRQPPRVVSALFLWASPDSRAEAGPRLERFSRELSLALESLAVLAAAAYLADLRLSGPSAQRHTVAVLDGSLSMSARLPQGRTVAEEARLLLERLAQDDGGVVTVIESGPRPRLALGPAAPRSGLRALRWQPTGAGHDPAGALALARELAGAGARVRLLTDRLPPEAASWGPEVEVHAVGAPLPNHGFVAASRSDRDGKATLALRLAQFSAEPAELALELRSEDGALLHEERVALAAGEEKALLVELAFGGPVVATLPPDALPDDDRLRLPPQPVRPLKVGLALPEGPAAEAVRRFLAADGSAQLAEAADLTFASPGAAVAPWTVTLGAHGEPRPLVGPFFADRRHPLLDSVPLEGLLWSAGGRVEGAPLLTSGEAVLVAEQPGPAFALNVALERSNLHRTAAWPVLLANLLALRREALPGFGRRAVALDEEPTAHLSPDARWSLAGPAGEHPLRGVGTVRLPAPGVPGSYRLLKDGQPVDELEVLPLDRSESDLRERGAGRRDSRAAAGRLSGDRPRSALPLALLALLLALDFYVTARSAGRRARRTAA